MTAQVRDMLDLVAVTRMSLDVEERKKWHASASVEAHTDTNNATKRATQLADCSKHRIRLVLAVPRGMPQWPAGMEIAT